MNYYNEIKEELINNEITKKIKDYSKNKSDLNTYYEVGRLLSEAGKHYGEGIIKEYSKKLTDELNKKYTTSMLYKIIQFYNIYLKVPTLSGTLSWSHWYEVLSIKDVSAVTYYLSRSINNNLSVRELRKIIKSNEYERLPIETRNKIVKKEENKIIDLIKNPILINNKYLIEYSSDNRIRSIEYEVKP